MSVAPERNAVVSGTVDPVLDGWNAAPDANAPLESEYRSPLDATQLLTSAQLQNVPAAQPTPVVAAIAAIPLRVWVPVLILIAILLCVSAAYDVLTIYTPGSWSNARWRFAIVGAAVPKMLKVTVAAALMTVAFTFVERRILSNIIAAILALISVALLAFTPLFLMDALQVRLILPTRMAGDVFVANVSFAMALMVLYSLVVFACAVTLRKTSQWLKLDLNSPEKVVNREWDR